MTSVVVSFDRKCAEMQALEEAHVTAIKKLEEDHNSCLAKLGDVTTDFERYYSPFHLFILTILFFFVEYIHLFFILVPL